MLIVGGATCSCSASTVNTDSMPPAPPSRWPVIDLVELTTSFLACSPNASLIALVSLTSPSGVDVPCALRYWTWSALSAGDAQRRLHRALRAVDVRRGHVVRVGAHAEADQLGVDLRAAPLGVLVLLEHQHAGAFAEHEAVAVLVPRPRRGLPDRRCGSRARAPRRSRRRRAARRSPRRRRRPSRRRRRTRSAGRPSPMQCRPVVQAVTIARFGPWKPNMIETWPGDHVDDRRRHEERRDAARPALLELGLGVLDQRQAADAGADQAADALALPRRRASSLVASPASRTAWIDAARP